MLVKKNSAGSPPAPLCRFSNWPMAAKFIASQTGPQPVDPSPVSETAIPSPVSFLRSAAPVAQLGKRTDVADWFYLPSWQRAAGEPIEPTKRDDGVIVFEGNRISAVGAASDTEVPPAARVIDANGGLIMPGIIDNHMHALWPNSPLTTRGEDTLYAVALGWPEDGRVRVRSLAKAAGQIAQVSLLGSSASPSWCSRYSGSWW